MLRVWLPLTKDLRNQGLSDITLTNNGATYSTTDGKLGGCYNFDGTNDYINIVCQDFPSIFAGKFSIAFWVYSNDDGTRSVYFGNYGLSGSGDWFNLEKHTANEIRFWWNNGNPDKRFNNTKILISDGWIHFAITKNDGIVKTYLNGQLIETYTNENLSTAIPSTATTFRIGGDYRVTGDLMFNGKMNDFRIYDHALSPMEVKQISQGLVLHYPLDNNGFGNENLLSNDKSNWGKYTCSSGVYGGSNSRFAPYQITIPILSSTKYICHITDYLELGQQFYIGVHQLSSDLTFLNDSGWKTVPYTFTSLSNATYVRLTFRDALNNNTNIQTYLDNIGEKILIKFEKGDKATPWCPNSSDALATTMGMNDGIEYDCSGFENNGEYYAYDSNGSISYTSDTPKYHVSTHIASANPSTSAASGTRYLYGHCSLINPTQMSVTFWLKPIEYGYRNNMGQGFFCTTNYEYGNTNVGADYQDSAMNHRDSAANINTSASTSQCLPYLEAIYNEWHHYAITFDGQTGKTYKDGVQIDSKQFADPTTLDSFIGVIVGFSKAGGAWRRNNAYYSDFRVYATALSADDILSLYQNSAYIDSSGNVYGAVHEEV